MPTTHEKLAESLNSQHELQSRGVIAIRSSDLSRTDRERLVASGWLFEVMKGWYVPSKPTDAPGDSTVWYASFWGFSAAYLADRFGKKWCLSPEQSLMLQGGNRTVPPQLIVRTPKGGNKPTPFAARHVPLRRAKRHAKRERNRRACESRHHL